MQSKNLWAKDLMEEATKAVQLEKSWPAESPYKEELELLRVRSGLRLHGTLIRQAMKAGKVGRWSELWESGKRNASTRVKMQECYDAVKQRERRAEEHSRFCRRARTS